MMSKKFALALAVLLCVLAATPAFAKDDRVSFGSDIVVPEGTTSGDLVCIFCSIKVHGEAGGDAVAILGSLEVDGERSVSGDAVVIGGDVSLGSEASIHRDLSVVAGDLSMAPTATVGGERTVIQGRGWLLLPLAPLVIFIGIVWLIVWFIQRNRYQFPVYPQGRGF